MVQHARPALRPGSSFSRLSRCHRTTRNGFAPPRPAQGARWRSARHVTEPVHTEPVAPDKGIHQTTLKAIALLIGVAATVLTPLVHLSSTNPLEVWSTVLVALIG